MPLNVLASIEVILLFSKCKPIKLLRPLNVLASIEVILLFTKYKYSKWLRPLNVGNWRARSPMPMFEFAEGRFVENSLN